MPVDLTLEEIRARGTEIIGALNRRDFDTIAAVDYFDNERSEFNSAISEAEGRAYIGLEGMRQWARDIDETWENFHVELLRVERAADGRVVVEYRATGTAKASGIPLDMHTAQIWTWDDDGVLIRNDSYTDPREAFAAAGVPY